MENLINYNNTNRSQTDVSNNLGIATTSISPAIRVQMANTYKSPVVNDIATIVRKKHNATSSSCVVTTNLIGKTRLIALFSIIALMTFLLIYNAIAMIALGANIEATEIAVSAQQEQVLELKNILNGISDEDIIMQKVAEAGFSASNTGIGSSVAGAEFITPETFGTQTNWFDQICEFFNSIFGG